MSDRPRKGYPIPPLASLPGPIFFFVVPAFFLGVLLAGWGSALLPVLAADGIRRRPGLAAISAFFLLFLGGIAIASLSMLLPWALFTFGPRQIVDGAIEEVRPERTPTAGGESMAWLIHYRYEVPLPRGGPLAFVVAEEVPEADARRAVPGPIRVACSRRHPRLSRRLPAPGS